MTLDKQVREVQRELSQALRHPITQDEWAQWKAHPVTSQFFLELEQRYYETLLEEPVVKAYLQRVSDGISLAHTNPVEETAINSAVKSGRLAVLDSLLGYEPTNLEESDDQS